MQNPWYSQFYTEFQLFESLHWSCSLIIPYYFVYRITHLFMLQMGNNCLVGSRVIILPPRRQWANKIFAINGSLISDLDQYSPCIRESSIPLSSTKHRAHRMWFSGLARFSPLTYSPLFSIVSFFSATSSMYTSSYIYSSICIRFRRRLFHFVNKWKPRENKKRNIELAMTFFLFTFESTSPLIEEQ